MSKDHSNKKRKPATSDFKRREKFQKKSDFEPALFAKVSEWDIEQGYERQPRFTNVDSDAKSRLPIRTDEGWVQSEATGMPSPIESSDESEESFAGLNSAEESDHLHSELTAEYARMPTKQEILECKEELARLASGLSQDPEGNISALSSIAAKVASPNAFIKTMALGTQLVVFKDILPTYRIRERFDEDANVKLSKEVRRLQQFEQTLLKSYKMYVKTLGVQARTRTRGKTDQQAKVDLIAVACACDLLLSVPHFNCRSDVLQILVEQLSRKRADQKFLKAREALELLFETDEDGYASLEAVEMITKMMKRKNHVVQENVPNTFLHLRLLSEFKSKASQRSIDEEASMTPKSRKKSKAKHEFRTRKDRKLFKERRIIEQEMKEADAAVSHEERDRLQGEILKLVFGAYFRILKSRSPRLTGVVLEGLARYSHLINQDFFGDILEVLRDLIRDKEEDPESLLDGDAANDLLPTMLYSRDALRETLLCIVTAFALLQGQYTASSVANSLNLDLKYFTTHLYHNIYPLCLGYGLEYNNSSVRTKEDHEKSARDIKHSAEKSSRVNAQTSAVLLIRALSSALIPPAGARAIPPLRIAAFVKSLMTASLQLQEKPSRAMLALIQKISKIHGPKIAALWYTEERRGNGAFDPLKAEAEGSNPFATNIWEGELLRQHYCPEIRDTVSIVETNIAACR